LLVLTGAGGYKVTFDFHVAGLLLLSRQGLEVILGLVASHGLPKSSENAHIWHGRPVKDQTKPIKTIDEEAIEDEGGEHGRRSKTRSCAVEQNPKQDNRDLI
jgi:hypothetical protein